MARAKKSRKLICMIDEDLLKNARRFFRAKSDAETVRRSVQYIVEMWRWQQSCGPDNPLLSPDALKDL